MIKKKKLSFEGQSENSMNLHNPTVGSNARDFFHAASLSYLFRCTEQYFTGPRNVRVINRGNINNQPRRR